MVSMRNPTLETLRNLSVSIELCRDDPAARQASQATALHPVPCSLPARQPGWRNAITGAGKIKDIPNFPPEGLIVPWTQTSQPCERGEDLASRTHFIDLEN